MSNPACPSISPAGAGRCSTSWCVSSGGKKGSFTIISPYISALLLALIRGGLMKKAVTSFAGNTYPTPGPNPLVQKAYISGAVEFENWTMLTITQRLLAGAMGWEFIPTRSLVGSTMAEENKGEFSVIDSPFGGGQTGLLKALRPDVTFVHGLAADRSGNTILPYPLSIDAFGAWAARSGSDRERGARRPHRLYTQPCPPRPYTGLHGQCGLRGALRRPPRGPAQLRYTTIRGLL